MMRNKSAAMPPMVPPTIAPTSGEFEFGLELLDDGLGLELLDDDEMLGVTLEESGPDKQQR
jgi:hypothetical protein